MWHPIVYMQNECYYSLVQCVQESSLNQVVIPYISSASLLLDPVVLRRCRALKITLNNGLLHLIYETAVSKMVFLLRHGDSCILPFNAIFFIDRNI